MDGDDIIMCDAIGQIVGFTVMMRPVKALQSGVPRMTGRLTAR